MPIEVKISQDSVFKDDESYGEYDGYFQRQLDETLDAVGSLDEVRFWPEYLKETVFLMTEYMLYHAQKACRQHLPSDRFWGVYVVGSAQERPPRLVDLDLLSVGNMGDAVGFGIPLSEYYLYPLAGFDLTEELSSEEMPEGFQTGEVDRATLFRYSAVKPNPTCDFRDLNIKVVDLAEEDEVVIPSLEEFERSVDVDSEGIPLSRHQLIRIDIAKVTRGQMDGDRFYR